MKIPALRNFSIIAHIDHGKSTLADRILQLTEAISEREMVAQFLDRMDLERERGITIKAQAIWLEYKAKDGQKYTLNLIDTPGHVDFTYEVSRSLAACEGALLVVDATQGVEAQTIANTLIALDNDLVIIPVINKIDLPNADTERVKREIQESLGIDCSEALCVSAKTGEGVEAVLEAIIEKIPPPEGDAQAPLKTLIFDSVYDNYRGVVVYVRVFDGSFKAGDKIELLANRKCFEVEETGIFTPERKQRGSLSAGEVGYLIAGIKDASDTRIGDTITDPKNPVATALKGYKEPKPMVYCGLYPIEGGEYEKLRDALTKLRLNDPSFIYNPESSKALGFGFRCGFLGLLHMDIVRERLEREYKLNLLITAPSAAYRIVKENGETLEISNPSEISAHNWSEIAEPYVKLTIIAPSEYLGAIMEFTKERRGEFKDVVYISEKRIELHYEVPLSEIIFDFFNQLKARTRGYASLDYEYLDYRPSDLVKIDILICGEPVDALSLVIHREKAYRKGKALIEKLRTIIPRQLFEVPLQAAIGSKIIARENIKAKRKDVLAKCYGGDITRKRKLLEKQKEGKKRMKQLGRVEVPQEAFIQILKAEED